jgi:hypothetical protein
MRNPDGIYITKEHNTYTAKNDGLRPMNSTPIAKKRSLNRWTRQIRKGGHKVRNAHPHA